jgi:lauroyl/myristoyl acyltransferase
MSLSKYIQQKEFLLSLQNAGPDALRQSVMNRGVEWFSAHSDEGMQIEKNLSGLGIAFDEGLIDRIQQHILLHYYEKLLPLCAEPASYHRFITDHVDTSQAIHIINSLSAAGKSIILATAHFGGVELIAPSLSIQKLPVSAAVRFTTLQFSSLIQSLAQKLSASTLFGQIRFIEIGNPNTAAAMEMAGALRRKDLLITIFDEKTEYSVPATLFGKKIWAGAGLDRLMKFSGVPCALCAAFMVRTSDDSYQLILDEVPGSDMQALYSNLEIQLKKHLEQWYFLHEEIPFVSE